MNVLKNMIVAGAATLAMAASGMAATLQLDFINVGPGLGIHYTNTGGTPTTSTTAGIFNWNVLASSDGSFAVGSTVHTFCIELTQFVADPTTFTCVSPDLAPNNSPPGPMGLARAALLGDLFARFHSSVIAGSIAGYTASEQAAAFQMAVWEITHETSNIAGSFVSSDTSLANLTILKNGLGLGSGNFKTAADGGDVDDARTLAGTFFASLLTNGLYNCGLLGLTSESNQDQIIAVPVPAPALLAGLGLVGALVLRRRMKA